MGEQTRLRRSIGEAPAPATSCSGATRQRSWVLRRHVARKRTCVSGAPLYQQHHPEATPLYGIVWNHLESFLEHAQERTGKRLPKYVEAEFRHYLECGIPAHGFARAQCSGCGHSLFLAFSCKLRGICPSCNARRMCNTAAHLTDHVLPEVRLRQWVLSVPFELRLLLALRPIALATVGRIFCQEVIRWQRRHSADQGHRHTRGGAVCFIQRFGGSLNLNVHYHVIVPDAVFAKAPNTGRATTINVPAPTSADLCDIAAATCARVIRWLERRGFLNASSADAQQEPTPLQLCLQGSLGLGDLTPTPKAKVPAEPQAPKSQKGLVGECNKFNIHAGVSVGPGCAQDREQLLRYCARAPLSLERLRVLEDGRIAYQVRHAHKHQAAVRVMTPLQFMARLAALIPPPRHPLIRFHGIFAPNNKWRSAVVPVEPACSGSQCKTQHSVSTLDVSTFEAPTSAPTPVPTTAIPIAASPPAPPPAFPRRIDWATLLRRVHNVDPLQCPKCGERMRFTELIEDKATAQEILAAEGQLSTPPPCARARAPDWPED